MPPAPNCIWDAHLDVIIPKSYDQVLASRMWATLRSHSEKELFAFHFLFSPFPSTGVATTAAISLNPGVESMLMAKKQLFQTDYIPL